MALRIQFLGDISLDGNYCDPRHHEILRQGWAEVAEWLGPCDLRVGNWEAPLFVGGMNLLKSPRLATTRETVQSFAPIGLSVALMANNHVYDCREEGFRATKALLESQGVRITGAAESVDLAAEPLALSSGGQTVKILNYVGPETHPCLPASCPIHINLLEPDRVLRDIQRAAGGEGNVVVALHWGEFERTPWPSEWQIAFARQCVDAGATIVAGCHAHCLQPDEPWKHGHIFYGLGNFVFNPYLSGDARLLSPWPTRCRIVGVPECRLVDGRVESVQWKYLTYPHLAMLPEPSSNPDYLERCRRCSHRWLSRPGWSRGFRRFTSRIHTTVESQIAIYGGVWHAMVAQFRKRLLGRQGNKCVY